jgi:hypothetical protein
MQSEEALDVALHGARALPSFRAGAREPYVAHVLYCAAFLKGYAWSVTHPDEPFTACLLAQRAAVAALPADSMALGVSTTAVTFDLVDAFETEAPAVQLSAVRLRLALLCRETCGTRANADWATRIGALPALCPAFVGVCTESTAVRPATRAWPGDDAAGDTLGSACPVDLDTAIANLRAYAGRVPIALRPYTDPDADGRLDSVTLVLPRRDIAANLLFHFVPDESVRLQLLEGLLQKVRAPQQWQAHRASTALELRAAALDVLDFAEMQLPPGVPPESEWVNSDVALVAAVHPGCYTERGLRWAQNTQLL